MPALNTSSNGLRRFPPDEGPRARPDQICGCTLCDLDEPGLDLVDDLDGALGQRCMEPLACVVWPEPTMERDDAACDALPCNVL